MVTRFADAATADFDSLARRQDDIDDAEILEFFQHAAGLVAQARSAATDNSDRSLGRMEVTRSVMNPFCGPPLRLSTRPVRLIRVNPDPNVFFDAR